MFVMLSLSRHVSTLIWRFVDTRLDQLVMGRLGEQQPKPYTRIYLFFVKHDAKGS